MKHIYTFLCLFLLSGVPSAYADEVTIIYLGGTYTGEVSNGVPHGQGTLNHPNGEKYVGEFKDGNLHGKGTYTYGSGPNSGDIYVGEFKDDKFHGQGTYTYADGYKYVGNFKDHKKNGQGTFTFPDGSKYVGEFKDGTLWNGTGYDKDGNVSETRSDGELTEK